MNLLQRFVSINGSQQDLKSFDCGEAGMNNFLHRSAEKHMGKSISSTFVLPVIKEGIIPGKNGKSPIAAYYTLTQTVISRDGIPHHSGLPKYPIPAFLLARLAVDKTRQGEGLGELTLVTALRRARECTAFPGVSSYGLVIDVLNERAMAFYESFDTFERMSDGDRRLFISNKTLEDI